MRTERTLVVCGAGGLLGQAVAAAAQTRGRACVGLSRADCDIADPASVVATFERYTPSVIINCAAYTNVDGAQTDVAGALRGNSLGPAVLARECGARGVTLVQVSTDHVFDGEARRPYEVDDAVGPLSVYGESKYAGERWARLLAPRHYVVRTAGLFGAGGRNFVDAIAGRLRRGEPLRVVADQTCDRTYASDLAEALLALADSEAPYGTYHVTNNTSGSWYDFAVAIARLLSLEATVEPVSTAAWGAPAPRPRWSVLSNRRWIDQGFAPLRGECKALAAYLGTAEQ